jgi:hypothetical protein
MMFDTQHRVFVYTVALYCIVRAPAKCWSPSYTAKYTKLYGIKSERSAAIKLAAFLIIRKKQGAICLLLFERKVAIS